VRVVVETTNLVPGKSLGDLQGQRAGSVHLTHGNAMEPNDLVTRWLEFGNKTETLLEAGGVLSLKYPIEHEPRKQNNKAECVYDAVMKNIVSGRGVQRVQRVRRV
jgi:hypothetical protein